MLELLNIWLILLWAAFPSTAWLLRFFIQKRIHGIVLFLITLFIGYFLFVGCAWLSDVVLEQKMNSFDLDGDGGIGGDEMTPQARKAMDDWASDTGRTLAIFTGLPFTAIWSAICLIPLCFGEWIIRRLIRSRKPEASPNEVVRRPTDDGNPFMPPGSS